MGRSTSFRYYFCRSVLLVVCLELTFSARAAAQYSFNHWSTDDGLPQNSVRSILQTRDGYIWFTTLDGVVRFDGVKFTTFNKGTTKGIQSNRFFALLEDAQGGLWMATEDGGVCLYRNGRFTSYSVNEGLGSDQVLSVHLGKNGAVLVYTGAGVSRWTGDRFASYLPGPDEPKQGFICGNYDKTLWSADQAGLHEFKDGVRTDYETPGRANPSALYQGRDGSVWVGTVDGRLFSFQNGAFKDWQLRLHYPDSFVTAMVEDKNGALWAGTSNQGLVRFSEGKTMFYTLANGLSDNRIYSLLEDSEGTIWAGTFNHGLNRIDRQIISVLSTRDGMTGDIVYPIYEDHQGGIWIGAEGLNRFDHGRFTTYRQQPGFEFYDAMSLLEDKDGRLWIGAVGGLSYLKDGRFVDFTPHIPLMPHNYNVWAIYQEREGTLWFGTDRGLIRYKDGSIVLLTEKDGLADNDVKCIVQTRDGRLWLGTYGGLTCLSNGKLTSLTQSDGLASNRIRTIYEDDDGTLWIGTYDGGLSRYKDGRFTNYTTSCGLFNDGVFQVLDDLKGNFWIGSNRGIYRVSKQELLDFAAGKAKSITSESYGKADGLLSIECNGGRQPAGIRTSDGKIWIPTQDGVAVIDPSSLASNPVAPPVIIETAGINRRGVDFTGGVRLRPGDSNLEINYTAPSFVKPEQVRFKYKMEGLDSDWVEAGTRRTAYYAYLPPGVYTFLVTAANSDGVWNPQPRRLSVTVLPPFWRTWWFTITCVASVVAIAFAAYRRRISMLRRAQAAQQEFSRRLIESQESERKRIAAELHDSLGQNLLVIKNWAVLGLGAVDHDSTRSPLSEISNAASAAISEVRQIAYNLRPHLLDEVGLTEALKAMVKRMATASGINFSVEIDAVDRDFSSDAAINVFRIVQEAVNNIVRHSRATMASVAVRRHDNEVVIEISDNGIGVSASSQRDGRAGFGLAGMAERAQMLGGKLTLVPISSSGAEQGARLEVRLPIVTNHER